jgi:hypothetical protein
MSGTERVGGHREGAIGVPLDEYVGRGTCSAGQPGQIEQWDEVLRRRCGEGKIGVMVEIDRMGRGAGHVIPDGVIESPRPVESSFRSVPVHTTQIVYDIAAAEDEHASLP